MVPLEYLSKFLRTLIMAVINCEINVILTWSVNCVTSNAAANKDKRFAITDTTLYILVITLSTKDNAELLQELQEGFKSIMNSNKYHSKAPPLNAQTRI